MHWKPSLSIYPGLETDPLVPDGDRQTLGNAILLARILGMIQEDETCAGWSAAALSHLREAAWHRYDRAPALMRDAVHRQLRKARFQFLKKRRLAIAS
jgi:hypothetical protein